VRYPVAMRSDAKRWAWLTLAALALTAPALTGCSSDDGDGRDPADVEVPACESDQAAPVCDVFQIVNQERGVAGESALAWNEQLAIAAQLHAEDMVAQNYFDHDSLDGRDFSDRANEAGYDAFATGENIAQGQQNATEVMDGWMNSPGHRSNILSGNSNEIGVGLAGVTWVQVFGQR
jgi:uncharacterized protein YkwD